MIDAVLNTMLVLCVLFLVRNQITYSVRTRAIDIAHQRAMADIDIGNHNWIRHYEEIEGYGSYDRMLFSLSKWTFAQFYPGLEGERS